MIKIEFRLVKVEELESVMQIYQDAAQQMIKDDFLTWKNGYPNENIAKEDIKEETLYGAYDEEGDILGVFTLNTSVDSTYSDVNWKTGDKPFLSFHRLAVSAKGKGKGVGGKLIDFSVEECKKCGYSSIRIDTYHKNWRALKLYHEKGFIDAGIIHLRDLDGDNICLEKIID